MPVCCFTDSRPLRRHPCETFPTSCMHTLVISNRKGGTAKTTVALNLAAELACRGQRVLLIDLDTQGHCGVGLGMKAASALHSVHHLFEHTGATLSAVICATAEPQLWLAPAYPLFDHGAGLRDPQRLRRAIEDEGLAQRFDFIVIDTPPSLDILLTNALMAGSRVVVPYVPHHLSYEGIRQLVRVLFPIMSGPNRALKLLGFVPTMASDSMRVHRAVNAATAGDFGASKLLPPVHNDIKLAEAMSRGQPIRRFAPASRGARDFIALADEVLRRLS